MFFPPFMLVLTLFQCQLSPLWWSTRLHSGCVAPRFAKLRFCSFGSIRGHPWSCRRFHAASFFCFLYSAGPKNIENNSIFLLMKSHLFGICGELGSYVFDSTFQRVRINSLPVFVLKTACINFSIEFFILHFRNHNADFRIQYQLFPLSMYLSIYELWCDLLNRSFRNGVLPLQ